MEVATSAAAQPQLPSAYYPGSAPAGQGSPDTFVLAFIDTSSEKRRQARALRATVLAVVVLLVILLILRTHRRGSRHSMRDLSRRLAQRGWTVYLMKGCGYCTKQMRELGEYPRHVVLSADPSHRVLGGNPRLITLDPRQIPAFPFWYRGGTEQRTGYQTPEQLEAMVS